jgi:hypothetical protein
MKFINGILSFSGLNTLMAAVVLYVLDYENPAMVLLMLSLFCFVVMLFFYLYKMYILIRLKK